MNYLKNIKLAIFDLDGTIIDSNYVWYTDKLYIEIFNEYNQQLTREELDYLLYSGSPTAFRNALQDVINKHNLNVNVDEILNKFYKYAVEEYKTIKFKKDAWTYLQYLKKNNIKISIATACRSDCLKSFFEANKLNDYFDFLLTTEKIGKEKDQPDIFLKVIDYFNVNKNEVIAFDDSLTAIKTLKKIGIITYGISDISNKHKEEEIKENADFYIEDFSSLYE